MSADLLRRAAALMRERAKAASPAPWWVHDANDCDVWWGDQAAVRAVDQDARALRPLMTDAEVEATWDRASTVIGNDVDRAEDAEHIASWHPAVALAVADWLEADATIIERHDLDVTVSQALAVARAYLGEAA